MRSVVAMGVALALGITLGMTRMARADLSGSEAAISFPSTVTFTGVGGGGQTRGYTFSLDSARTLTDLGMWSYSGDTSADVDRQIGVWNSTGSLVASVTIPAGTGEVDPAAKPNPFIYQALATPVSLASGNYTVAIWWETDNTPGMAYGFSEVDTIAGFHYGQTVETATASPGDLALTEPTVVRTDRLNGYIGPNLRFAVPEPSTAGLVLVAFAGTLLRRRKR